jgi:low temperature requirement protein LtrA
VLLGGPALYLFGNFLFKRATTATRTALSHLIGLGVLALLIPVSLLVSPLLLGAATTGVLILVAAWETVSFSRRRAKPEPGIEVPAQAET